LTTDFDVDWIDIVLAAGQPQYNITDYDTCRWCLHEWHGVTCRHSSCACESAVTCRDDSWRWPITTYLLQDRLHTLMSETGCDGWVAQQASGGTVVGTSRPSVLKRALYGEAA
jgi:hypothetical protein